MSFPGQLQDGRFGFSMPVDSPLYPAPPYRYQAATFISFDYLTDPAVASSILPEGMELDDPPMAGLIFASYPESSLGPYDEVVLYLQVRHRGEPIKYGAYLYVTSDAAMAAGREMGGFPKKIARIDVRLGPEFGGVMERPAGLAICSGSMTPEARIDPMPPQIPLSYATLRLIPSPLKGSPPSLREVVLSHWMITPTEMWTGSGTFELTGASEADPLHRVPVVEHRGCRLIRGDVLVDQSQGPGSPPAPADPAASAASGLETIPPGEEAGIAEIVALQMRIQDESDRLRRPVPRSQHPKMHGCVRAEFIVEPDLPEELRHGVFRGARTYPAVVRFSNGSQWDDTKADIHGMAVKLLDVAGPKLLEDEPHATTQDFVMIDQPAFFIRDVDDYIPAMTLLRRLKRPGFGPGKLLAILEVLLSPAQRYRLLRASRSRPDSPLRARYWGATPYALGPRAIKFSARPDLSLVPPPEPSNGKDRYREAMADHLRRSEARFDFLVQLQADPAAMPVEDGTVAWDEALAPPRKVATIRIPSQEFQSPGRVAFGENLSFTPWHSLAEHRPLGGVNRARKAVYQALARRRRAFNGASTDEPTDIGP